MVLAGALVAACGSTPTVESASFRGPTAAAVFAGRGPSRPGVLWPYLAVANGRGDELRIVDPAADQAVRSPGYAFPLSIPTLPRPLFLASASLRDGEADLLAVAGVGALVQVVATWADGTDGAGPRVIASYDLAEVAGPGAEIVSMIGVPYPGPTGGVPPVAAAAPGRALLLVGFTGSADGLGGKLVALELARGQDGRAVELVAAATAVQPLGFDPVSQALSPDGFHLYCATPDLVTDFTTFPPPAGSRQVLGVAELDLSSGPAGSWPVRGLDARAPTTLVAAAIVGERWPLDPERFGPPAPRVYAVLDPSGCGPERAIACGVATLDPAAGVLAADPAPAGRAVPRQPFRAPYTLPAIPMALSVAMPAASGAQQCLDDCRDKGVNRPVEPSQGDPSPVQPTPQPLMVLAPATGQRWTSGAAVAAAADGRAYVLDLGRWSAPNQLAMLSAQAPSQRMRVEGTSWSSPALGGATAAIGLYLQYPGADERPGLYVDKTVERAVVLTPGFTTDEIWTLTWQGPLPGLVHEASDIGLLGDGSLVLALQTRLGTGWVVGPQVDDPRLGVHGADAWPQGDLVEFAFADDPCGLVDGNGTPVPHEATILTVLAASVEHPGGALQLAVPTAPAPDPFNLRCLASELAGGTSFADKDGWATVRASGLVLTGGRTGYAGRPPLLTKADVLAGTPQAKRFDFAWADETGLTGEALSLARKARRFYYPWQPPCLPGQLCPYDGLYAELTDPLAPGPVAGFIAGPICFDVTSSDRVCPDQRLGELLRDTTLRFQTFSGVLPMFRVASPISLPTGAVAFDKSQFGTGDTGAVWYVTYQYDSVFMMAPGSFVTVSTTLR